MAGKIPKLKPPVMKHATISTRTTEEFKKRVERCGEKRGYKLSAFAYELLKVAMEIEERG